MKAEKFLLRSDNFHLFAGIGPLVEGYVIISPHHCDWKKGGLTSFSEITGELLDELILLRGLVARFYREAYSFEGALCFEHGRAGTCGVSETPHCYHAHLCCFPCNESVWEDIDQSLRTVERLDDMGDLGAAVGTRPYLMLQNLQVDESAGQGASRQQWQTRIVDLDNLTDVPRQYLRKLLAKRLGKEQKWDWAAAPDDHVVAAVCEKFRAWLDDGGIDDVSIGDDQWPTISFADTVKHENRRGYDQIASKYDDVYREPPASMQKVLDEFCDFLCPADQPVIIKHILDDGCGVGIHLREFLNRGFNCTGVDGSPDMLATAEKNLNQFGKRLDLRHGDAFKLEKFDPETFHGIWVCAILVHLPRRFLLSFLKRIFVLLKPGGVVYLSAQAGGDSIYRFERRFFIYYSREELEIAAHAAGFQVLKCWHDTFNKGTCGDTRTKHWINWFLTRPE